MFRIKIKKKIYQWKLGWKIFIFSVEKEMGNRGSKSAAFLLNSAAVKEQRVDDSIYRVYTPYIRCTLTDFERNYPIKTLSAYASLPS
jgi:hypothetical protein